MQCPNCGSFIQIAKLFCPDCGGRILPQQRIVSSSHWSSVPPTTGLAGVGWQPTPVSHPTPLQSYSCLSLDPDEAPPDFDGEVQAFQQRTEQVATYQGSQMSNQIQTVWTFRVIRRDSRGDALPPIPIEMRGPRFLGTIQNGDRVRVPCAWQAGKIIHVNQVYNLTAASHVRVVGAMGPFGRVVGFVFGIGFSLVAVAFLMLGLNMPNFGWFNIAWTVMCIIFIIMGVTNALSSLFKENG